MSYTAALKMPSSYAVMNEEEMTYLEGGEKWSGEKFKNNLIGAWNNIREAQTALKLGGLTVGKIAGMASMSANAIVLNYGVSISAAIGSVGGVVAGLLALGGIALAVDYLGKNRVWY